MPCGAPGRATVAAGGVFDTAPGTPPAWPGPVWGHSPAQPYEAEVLAMALVSARAALGL